jgi:hypothetical protein
VTVEDRVFVCWLCKHGSINLAESHCIVAFISRIDLHDIRSVSSEGMKWTFSSST